MLNNGRFWQIPDDKVFIFKCCACLQNFRPKFEVLSEKRQLRGTERRGFTRCARSPINRDACVGADADRVLNALVETPTSCNFSEDFNEWYGESLCEEFYTGPLCGSCTDKAGKFGRSCRECLGGGAGVLLISLVILIVSFLVILQMKGNLESFEHWTQRQISSAINQQTRWHSRRSRRRLGRTGGQGTSVVSQRRDPSPTNARVYREKENHAKWKFVELIKVDNTFLPNLTHGLCRSR